ncbi:hypothetical protein [Pseudarcicella hirudinis]|uniref:hypothetical protein n=1 Tax=Pseudarcicella hirudinis TaxID=1079859 RepID=UPI0011605EEC|nr:hypothetical protein [Pseudarcicella hirudinis]
MEAGKYNLQDWDRIVPFNITSPDAGSDGRIEWNGTPPTTKWLKNKFTIFQNKATDLLPSNCKKEILEPAKKGQSQRKLKAQIEKVVKANGCYILFTNKSIVDQGKDERIAQFREAIQLAGEPNYETFQIIIYDSNSIKDWVNDYLSAIILVQKFNGINRPLCFMGWDKWDKTFKSDETKYRSNATILANIKLINNSILSEKVIRVTGQSGLGKTRLVLEAFRDSPFNKSIVYYDLNGMSIITDIKTYLMSVQDSQYGIIIIDNCDPKSHIILSQVVKSSGNIKIVTIGPDNSDSIEDSIIKLDRDNQKDIVKEIIKDKIGLSHQSNDIEYLSELCEGYPWMANRFCKSILQKGTNNFSGTLQKDFIEKLLFGGRENEREYKVIRACSVFSSFGFPDDEILDTITGEQADRLEAQLNYIRTNILDIDVSLSEFYEICQKYKQQDIIERHSVYYVVKPTVLAINLATDWLKNNPISKIISILTELKDNELGRKIAERIKDLDQVDKAHQIVGELWGPNSPFGLAEVLNTSWGSLLFRYVVEVNPVATAKALETSFGKMSKEEILKIDEGRRNLVWALEKLCFRKQSFSRAAKILYSFAVSENETWGNNSTNQFRQLFQLFLSGTEASLKERLEIIKWGLNKKDDDFTKIAIQAISKGLMNDHFHRMGGPEKQGSSAPLQDYSPNWEEITDYWKEIISMLTDIVCSNSPHSELAKEKIAHSIRSLMIGHGSEIVIDSIRKIIEIKGNLWIDALNSLKMTLGYEKSIPQNIVNQIESLIIDLTPTDTKNQLFLKVTKPEWDNHEKDDNNIYINKPKLNAEKYAQKLFDEHISWVEYISDLLQGSQRQAFAFGSKVGELTDDKETLIDISIEALKKIEKENQNPELIAGILFGSNNLMMSEKTIDRFISTDEIRQHAFYLTKVLCPSYHNIEKLFLLVDKYDFSISQFQNFQYGRALEVLTNEEILLLCSTISKYGNLGKWTSLSLLYMFCYNNEDKWTQNKDFLKELISNNNMIINNDETEKMESSCWSDVVMEILVKDNDSVFAITITKQIVEFCSDIHFNYSLDIQIANIIQLLFKKYFDITWDFLGQGIIGDYMTFSNLEHIIGKMNGYLYKKEGIVFEDPEHYETILTWCRKHPKIAPERIAHMMPLNINENGEIKWHPFSKAIIDEFGDNEKLIDYLASNMGSFGTVGSSVPYFITQKKLLQELINHPIQRLKNWAHTMLEYTNKRIKIEQLDDEASFL